MDNLELARALAEPFEASEIKVKPQAISGSRAMAVHYVDVRVVMDRLDAVFGVGGWQTSYREAKGGVICQLTVKVNGEWITHEDLGGESDQPDEGDAQKAAHSDSLKRAAIHLGIGRYLYRIPRQWADYDPQKKQFVNPPKLPPSALPRKTAPEPETKVVPTLGATVGNRTMELVLRWEDQAVKTGLCAEGEMIAHLNQTLGSKWVKLPLDIVKKVVVDFGEPRRGRQAIAAG